MDVIKRALAEGRSVLSEYESKKILAAYGIPTTREILTTTQPELTAAIEKIGYPVALKGCFPGMAHKTEQGAVFVDVRSEGEALSAFRAIADMMDGKPSVLVQEMVKGPRELVIGMTRDPQFGPNVMFGLGGIFTEILQDVVFRTAPLEKTDALAMMNEIKGRKILESVRGMPPVDLDLLGWMLVQVSAAGLENESIREIDVNPVIIDPSGRPTAVDALIVLDPNV